MRSNSHVRSLIERQMAMFHAQERAAREAPPAARQAAPPRPQPRPLPYVAISRQYGAGGAALAGKIAERLGWTLYDRELVDEIARDAHLQERLLEPFDEHVRNDMEHWIRGLLTEDTVSEHHYTRSLFHVLSSIARVGHAVIVGRGAHLALPEAQGLRVRIFAPLDYRVERVMASQHLSHHDARRRVDKEENERQGWLHRAFGDRAKDHFSFDLALNPAALNEETCVTLVLTALEGKCGPLR
ncbi:MAG: cytidylate kinase-like family protein [Armatimonadetes bacterium]|nr:cytidylate kinase-like family protein [Armatimonadota bacterium]